uniref:hypothetical protein n=1 Tax=Chamaesiphon sp. OTE_75_metabat_556 TaxID=2964692 RepID=UPI00286AF71A
MNPPRNLARMLHAFLERVAQQGQHHPRVVDLPSDRALDRPGAVREPRQIELPQRRPQHTANRNRGDRADKCSHYPTRQRGNRSLGKSDRWQIAKQEDKDDRHPPIGEHINDDGWLTKHALTERSYNFQCMRIHVRTNNLPQRNAAIFIAADINYVNLVGGDREIAYNILRQ